MKGLARGLMLVVVVLLLGWLVIKRSRPTSTADLPARAEGTGTRPAAPATSGSAAGPTANSTRTSPKPSEQRVIRLTSEERVRLASRIEAARKARAARPLPRLPDNAAGSGADGNAMATAQQVVEQLQGVADEVRGYVAECAKYAPELKSFTTQITLTGDPDIGTLIDAPAAAKGSDGQPVPAAFDDCIRGQLQTLELPPMKTGDKFAVDYEIEL